MYFLCVFCNWRNKSQPRNNRKCKENNTNCKCCKKKRYHEYEQAKTCSYFSLWRVSTHSKTSLTRFWAPFFVIPTVHFDSPELSLLFIIFLISERSASLYHALFSS